MLGFMAFTSSPFLLFDPCILQDWVNRLRLWNIDLVQKIPLLFKGVLKKKKTSENRGRRKNFLKKIIDLV